MLLKLPTLGSLRILYLKVLQSNDTVNHESHGLLSVHCSLSRRNKNGNID